MERRDVLAAIAGSGLMLGGEQQGSGKQNSILELKTWYLHNSSEEQGKRLAGYLQGGLAVALESAGVHLDGAFANVIAPDGPFYLTLIEYESLAAMAAVNDKLRSDATHMDAAKKSAAGGAPFVSVESSLLRSFDVMPKIDRAAKGSGDRIFELRTYQAPSFPALTKKVGMFNDGEAKIFERLGMRPVFFGETFAGPRQPNLIYMLSYDNLAARDKLWQSFVGDPEWKKLSAIPELKDAEIVSNISNVILRALPFSKIR